MTRAEIEKWLQEAEGPVADGEAQVWKFRFGVVAALLLGIEKPKITRRDPYRGGAVPDGNEAD